MAEAYSLIYVTETDKAWCVAEMQEGEAIWLPKSAVDIDYDEEIDPALLEGEVIDMVIPEWLAEEKGLI